MIWISSNTFKMILPNTAENTQCIQTSVSLANPITQINLI